MVANAAANFSAVRLGQLWSLILFVSALLPQLHFPNQGFPARFLGPVGPNVTLLDGKALANGSNAGGETGPGEGRTALSTPASPAVDGGAAPLWWQPIGSGYQHPVTAGYLIIAYIPDNPPRSASELLSGQETSTAVYSFSTILNCYGSRAVIAVSRSIRWYSWKLSRVSGM